MRIRGIHYGLTLLYSYLLPVVDVEETSYGFRFKYVAGSLKGLECAFREKVLEAECSTSSVVEHTSVEHLLGLSKHNLFRELCRLLNLSECVVDNITLIYEPKYKKYVAYSVYLSRNTDYYANTVRWVREVVSEGYVKSTSYIAREFNRVKSQVDQVLERSLEHTGEAVELMSISGFGVKLAKAYLLHAYGLTEHAPVDRHYAVFLNAKPTKYPKSTCIKQMLNCSECSKQCPYAYSTKKYGVFNGVVQSLVYIYKRLVSKRKSPVESSLVKDAQHYADKLEEALVQARLFQLSRQKQN